MGSNNVLEIVRLTDVGLQRTHNEDAIASDANIGFLILADGMGGYNAGEVASEMAVLSIAAELSEALGPHSSKSGLLDIASQSYINNETLKKLLIDVVSNANTSIYQASQTYSKCSGMGTTLVLGLFANHQLLVGHVGDSRLYRLRNRQLEQLTEDHSLLQEEIRAGILTPEQARDCPHKNLLTRALGVEPEVELELNAFNVEAGDLYLACSDGLSDLLDDDLIASTLNDDMLDLTVAADTLVRLTNQFGGKDNISVILAKVNSRYDYQKTWYDHFVDWIK